MPVLDNPRYERFALEIVGGTQRYAAYQKAGYRANAAAAAANATRLLQNANVKARIAELQKEIADSRVMSGREVLEELSKIGRANMADYVQVNADGDPRVDWTDLPRDKMAAIQAVTIEEFTDGRSDKREVRRVKFTLVPKTPALELLGKHHGLMVERHEVKHSGTILHALLKEIDAESREIVTIEHQAADQQEDDVL